MKLNDRTAYVILLAASISFAIVGALLALFGFVNPALFFLGAVVAVFPLLAHIRMRRAVAALRKGGVTASAVDLSGVQGSFDSLDRTLSTISDEIHELSLNSTRTSSSDNKDLSHIANEMRRESRMLRLIAEDVRGSFSDPK